MKIEPGMTGRAERTISQTHTAQAAGSGSLPVLATPWMVALMEQAACAAVEEGLLEEETSVGTGLSITHSSATPVDLTVWAEATVTAVDKRQITFSVTAYDSFGVIGEGTHTRVVVDAQRFLDKTQQKGNS